MGKIPIRATPRLARGTSPQPPADPPTRMHRRLWLAAKVIFAFVASTLALIGTVYGIWGPPWPTEPSFVPGAPSLGSPFDVSFSGTNKSAFFSISNITVRCSLSCFRVLTPSGVPVMTVGPKANLLIRASGPKNLGPNETQPFTCNLRGVILAGGRDAADAFPDVEMRLNSEYDSPWLFWLRRKSAIGELFSLNKKTVPPQWVEGELPGTCDF